MVLPMMNDVVLIGAMRTCSMVPVSFSRTTDSAVDVTPTIMAMKATSPGMPQCVTPSAGGATTNQITAPWATTINWGFPIIMRDTIGGAPPVKVPLGNVMAQLNIDMIGRGGPRDLAAFLGHGVALHDGRPDRARVIDVYVDLARAHLLESRFDVAAERDDAEVRPPIGQRVDSLIERLHFAVFAGCRLRRRRTLHRCR